MGERAITDWPEPYASWLPGDQWMPDNRAAAPPDHPVSVAHARYAVIAVQLGEDHPDAIHAQQTWETLDAQSALKSNWI